MQSAARGCVTIARRQGSQLLRAYSSSAVRFGDAAAAAPAAAVADGDGGDAKPFASARVEEVFNKMTTLEREELSTIADIVNEKLGLKVTEWDLMGFGGGGVAASAGGADADGDDVGAEAVEEKTAFDLKLVSFDAKAKIKVIKEVRSIAGLGLKEAKEVRTATCFFIICCRICIFSSHPTFLRIRIHIMHNLFVISPSCTVACGGSTKDGYEGDQEGRSRGAQGEAGGIGCCGGNCLVKSRASTRSFLYF